MPNTLTRKFELAANFAIIVVAAVLCGVLIKTYFLGGRAQTATPPTSLIGTKLALPQVDWRANGQTLVLVLQKGCHFCSESAPFYQRLVDETKQSSVRLVAVLPQEVAESQQYLAELHVPISDIRQATLSAVGVRGTPTLLLVNAAGVVEDSWVGKLPPEREEQVLRRLQSLPR